jgi:hypothetical protein
MEGGLANKLKEVIVFFFFKLWMLVFYSPLTKLELYSFTSVNSYMRLVELFNPFNDYCLLREWLLTF